MPPPPHSPKNSIQSPPLLSISSPGKKNLQRCCWCCAASGQGLASDLAMSILSWTGQLGPRLEPCWCVINEVTISPLIASHGFWLRARPSHRLRGREKKKNNNNNYLGHVVVENPNRKAKTPHLEDNLVIIKDPKRTRVCL